MLEPFSDRVPGMDGFSFDIEYHIEASGSGTSSPRDLRSACVAAMRAIVEPALARCDVLRPSVAEHDVNRDLSTLLPSRSQGLVIERSWTAVRVDARTREAAERLAEARQDAKADGVRRDGIRARMLFLQQEVLRDRAGLRLYLLAEGMGGAKSAPIFSVTELETLAEEVRQWSPTNRWVVTAQILHDYLDRLPPDAVLKFVSALRDGIRDSQHLDLLKRFDAVHRSQL